MLYFCEGIDWGVLLHPIAVLNSIDLDFVYEGKSYLSWKIMPFDAASTSGNMSFNTCSLSVLKIQTFTSELCKSILMVQFGAIHFSDLLHV